MGGPSRRTEPLPVSRTVPGTFARRISFDTLTLDTEAIISRPKAKRPPHILRRDILRAGSITAGSLVTGCTGGLMGLRHRFRDPLQVQRFAPIDLGERATVGSSKNTWRRNRLTGASGLVGTVFGPGIDTATEANLDTSEWTDNVYEGASQTGMTFHWDRRVMDLATWRRDGQG